MKEFRNQIDMINGFNYCFEIVPPYGHTLFLTSASKQVRIESSVYFPDCGLTIEEAVFNDSANDYILVKGIYCKNTIDRYLDLNGAKVKILIFKNNNFHHYITYYCSIYTKYDLHFVMRLESEILAYNQTLLKSYSKTCRANFGDNKCKINKNLYTFSYDVVAVEGTEIKLLNMDKENSYFTGGELIIVDHKFKTKIISHYGDMIKIAATLPDIKGYYMVLLAAGCNKKFITCCNQFNNAVNFRGEPLIPEYNFLKAG